MGNAIIAVKNSRWEPTSPDSVSAKAIQRQCSIYYSKVDTSKGVPTNKLLLCFPFWAGDKEQSKKMLRLMADLEPGRCVCADILLVPRFDSDVDVDTVRYVERKFDVRVFKCQKTLTGWPAGCNGMMWGLVEWIYNNIVSGKILSYPAIVILGADVVPLSKWWIELLGQQWCSLNTQQKTFIAGAFVPGQGEHLGHDHINGDCVVLSADLDFLRWLYIKFVGLSNRAGWDWELSAQFKKKGWAAMPGMQSWWRKTDFTEAEWNFELGRGTFLYHGIKSDVLLDMSRKKLLEGI